jgi:hypothetical protein
MIHYDEIDCYISYLPAYRGCVTLLVLKNTDKTSWNPKYS